jgi:hypothetical protein
MQQRTAQKGERMIPRIILALCAILALSGVLALGQAGSAEAQRPAVPTPPVVPTPHAGPPLPHPPMANPPSPAEAAHAAAIKLQRLQAIIAEHPGWRLAGPNDRPPSDAMPPGTPPRGPGPSTIPPEQRRSEIPGMRLLGVQDEPEAYHLTNCTPGLYSAQFGAYLYGLQGWQWCYNSLGSQVYEAMILIDDTYICDSTHCWVYTYEQQGCAANWRQNYDLWYCQPDRYYYFPIPGGTWVRGRVDHHGDNGVEHYYGYSLTQWMFGGYVAEAPSLSDDS